MQVEAKQPLRLDPCPPLSNYHVEFWEITYADTESERVFQRDSSQVLEETGVVDLHLKGQKKGFIINCKLSDISALRGSSGA